MVRRPWQEADEERDAWHREFARLTTSFALGTFDSARLPGGWRERPSFVVSRTDVEHWDRACDEIASLVGA